MKQAILWKFFSCLAQTKRFAFEMIFSQILFAQRLRASSSTPLKIVGLVAVLASQDTGFL
jgi:hypothetical protein